MQCVRSDVRPLGTLLLSVLFLPLVTGTFRSRSVAECHDIAVISTTVREETPSL